MTRMRIRSVHRAARERALMTAQNINCTFLRVLPDAPAREAAALEVLQQLASQFAPLMSAAALRVTSLEEGSSFFPSLHLPDGPPSWLPSAPS